jgi:hypothetical protein
MDLLLSFQYGHVSISHYVQPNQAEQERIFNPQTINDYVGTITSLDDFVGIRVMLYWSLCVLKIEYLRKISLLYLTKINPRECYHIIFIKMALLCLCKSRPYCALTIKLIGVKR